MIKSLKLSKKVILDAATLRIVHRKVLHGHQVGALIAANPGDSGFELEFVTTALEEFYLPPTFANNLKLGMRIDQATRGKPYYDIRYALMRSCLCTMANGAIVAASGDPSNFLNSYGQNEWNTQLAVNVICERKPEYWDRVLYKVIEFQLNSFTTTKDILANDDIIKVLETFEENNMKDQVSNLCQIIDQRSKNEFLREYAKKISKGKSTEK